MRRIIVAVSYAPDTSNSPDSPFRLLVPLPSSRPRILIVRLSHLGDVVHALPVYHAVREVAPEAEIAWAIQPEFAELIEGLAGLSRVIRFDRRGGARAWPRLWRELRSFDADWAIDVQGNIKSAAATLLSGAPRRSGFHSGEWKERLGAMVLNDRPPAAPPSASDHVIERNLRLARHLCGLPADWMPPSCWLEVTPEEKRGAEESWRTHLGEAPGRPILVQLAAPGDPRAWPVEQQRVLLSELASSGFSPLALSGPGEEELGGQLRREFGDDPRILHWVGQRGQRELAAFFTVAAERGASLVCCDSGPLHVAVACGMKVIALAGPQDPERTGPWRGGERGREHRVVKADPEVDCAPCFARECPLPEGARCMSEISVQAVVQAVAER
jgi:heptosyltransferase I